MKSVGKKRGLHSRPQKDRYQQQAGSSQDKGVETIIAEWVTRRHRVPPMREYLVFGKSLPRRKANWESENALGKLVNWNRLFETEVSTRSLISLVGESVTTHSLGPTIIGE